MTDPSIQELQLVVLSVSWADLPNTEHKGGSLKEVLSTLRANVLYTVAPSS